ncbi:hypothetical protein CGCA056_v006809 [Colletotrichum aenigma]|uniref:uncharacterized protein n=1 Tax=Colletotrichum aenigma TaxID=1215731 RepID=UPI00187307DD|nr:uncharacterized protein CGCA056_v006809 [Colletotrichum aenigma]KAF5521723.1 hypothetical protein CGCA056_v006809 [Colletotrichum aenigma]
MARLTYPEPQAKGLNVLKQFAHTPATAKHWASIGAAQFKDLELSNKNRELSILLSTSKFRSSYEFSHHVPVSTKEGVTDAQREVLIQAGKQKGFLAGKDGSGQLKDLFTQKERTLLVFLEAVIEGPEVDDKVFAGAKAELSDREIVELITLQTLTRFGRFFQTYVKLQELTVYRVALHDISVPNLDSLPTTEALVKNAFRDEALTAALRNPEHMCWSCYNCLFGLYENLFVRIEKRDGRIRVPMYALMIRWETRPIANALLISLASIGAIFLAESAHIVLDL